MIEKVNPVLISWPIGQGEPAAGSIIAICHQCGTPVWLSPASQYILHLHHPPIYCIDCVSPMLAAAEEQGATITGEWTADAVQRISRRNN
jgi:hypothetical protein